MPCFRIIFQKRFRSFMTYLTNRPAIILLKLMSFAWKRKAVDISFFVQRRDFYVIDYCINFITWHVYGMDM